MRIYVTGNDGNKNLLVFSVIFSSPILDSKKKITNWISTGILTEKIEPFDINLDPAMSN